MQVFIIKVLTNPRIHLLYNTIYCANEGLRGDVFVYLVLTRCFNLPYL